MNMKLVKIFAALIFLVFARMALLPEDTETVSVIPTQAGGMTLSAQENHCKAELLDILPKAEQVTYLHKVEGIVVNFHMQEFGQLAYFCEFPK